MDIDYKEVISFKRLKECLQERQIKIVDFSRELGLDRTQVSGIINGVAFPKTDIIARLCFALKVPASEICTFYGYETNPYFKDKELLYKPPEDASGDLTYRPLRRFLEEYLREHKEKTANDLFDKIEPSRRRNGQFSEDGVKKALQNSLLTRGITDEYEKKDKRERRYSAKGLTPETRAKLRQDRPLNIRNIYDICRFLGCSIDFVMSYK